MNNRAQAVSLANEGLSYRKIAHRLGVDESTVRRDPAVREAKLGVDPQAHSRFNGSSVYCRVESAPELIANIECDLDRILGEKYTLNRQDALRLRKVLKSGLEVISA